VVYSYLMNNYWHTNYKADQEGRAEFRFSIAPHGPYEAEAAVRRGREAREPLLVLPSRAGSPPSRPSLFRVSPAAVLVSSLKPLAGGSAWLVGLYNPTDTARQAALDWEPSGAVSMHRSESTGRPGAGISGGLTVPAWGTVFVRVERTDRGSLP
jgi:alpha-mannosidase